MDGSPGAEAPRDPGGGESPRSAPSCRRCPPPEGPGRCGRWPSSARRRRSRRRVRRGRGCTRRPAPPPRSSDRAAPGGRCRPRARRRQGSSTSRDCARRPGSVPWGECRLPARRGSALRLGPVKASMILMAAGPRITMNSAGRMQKISGKRIFTGTFCASSSARCERLIRISRACTRSTLAMGMPKASACTIAVTNPLQLGHVRSLAEGAHGVAAAGADLHLLQDAEELVRKRPFGVPGDLGQARRRIRGPPRPRC